MSKKDEEKSLREALDGAFETSEKEPEEVAEAAVEASPDPVESEVVESTEPEVEAIEPAADAPEPEPEPAPQAISAPQSWKNDVKAEWDKLPPSVQAEVTRRESENARILQESSQARHLVGEVQKVVAPYQQYFQSQGVDPLVGIANTLKLASTLQSGDQNTKAQTVARIIKDFGVDIRTLDGVLANAPVAQQANPLAADPEYAEMKRFYAEQRQRQQHDMQQQEMQTKTATEQFLEENPIAKQLCNEMADFMDVAQARGRQMTLQEAYNAALAMRPDLQQHTQQQQNLASSQDKLSKARAAGVSIAQKSDLPRGNVAPTSLRGVIEEAWGG